MTESHKELLNKRRDRVIAIILGVKERECDEYLPPEVSAKLRKVVLDQVNELCDLASDLLRSEPEATVVNEIFLQKLEEIHEAVVGNVLL